MPGGRRDTGELATLRPRERRRHPQHGSVAEEVGAAAFMGLMVISALVTSLVLDHFGWLGFDIQAAGLARLGGGLRLICLF